ncbi:hypothetical protein GCM10019997_20210 [Prevotella corporis]
MQGYEQFITFVEKWERKYPALRKYKAERNSAYFTYMDFPAQVQRCIYTTNWIERLNRKYRRTIQMRTSMPSEKSVIFLLAAVAMEETKTTYERRIYQFKNWKEKNKITAEKGKLNYTLLRTLPSVNDVYMIGDYRCFGCVAQPFE